MTPRNITEQLRRDEGEVKHAYEDSEGYLTIGIGHLIDKRKGGGLSKAAIEFIFAEDLRDKTDELRRRLPGFVLHDVVRQGVIINMAFQLGVDGVLGFKRMVDAFTRRDYVTAASHMKDSLWYKQTPERSERLINQMRTGQWY